MRREDYKNGNKKEIPQQKTRKQKINKTQERNETTIKGILNMNKKNIHELFKRFPVLKQEFAASTTVGTAHFEGKEFETTLLFKFPSKFSAAPSFC